MKPNLVVVGFPKSGTTTIQTAFTKSGIKSVHWMKDDKPVGQLIYEGYYQEQDPFFHFDGIQAITQMDFCDFIKEQGRRRLVSLWPNLDIAMLLAIRRRYPECKFILNYRDPEKTVSSISRWFNLQDRITRAECPNLPSGFGTSSELVQWIENHHQTLRDLFADDKNFIEIDIASPTAKQELESFIGTEFSWWGVKNKGKSTTTTT